MHIRLLAVALTALSISSPVFATPSGLNNIPTADTTPQGTFVLQAFSTVGAEREEDFNLGFKTGLQTPVVRFEFGAFYHVWPGYSGPFFGHAKVAVPFGKGLPTVAIGAAGIPFSSSDRNGDVFGYAVVTQDFNFLRAHAGVAYEDTDARPFFGLDKTIRVERSRILNEGGKNPRVATSPLPGGGGRGPGSGDPNSALVTRDLFTLRADAIQLRTDDWLFSFGVLVPITKNIVLEAWGNFPSDDREPSATLKANLVFEF